MFGERRRRLTARLALLMFKEDVGQVLAWLTEHGEPFLHRQTCVGKSIQRAEQLYSAHMQFEQVSAEATFFLYFIFTNLVNCILHYLIICIIKNNLRNVNQINQNNFVHDLLSQY